MDGITLMYEVNFVNDNSYKFYVVKEKGKPSPPVEFHESFFHSKGMWKGIGFPDNKTITEVWIPWHRIGHVENLMYRQKK